MNTGTENPSERVPRQQLPEFAEGANRILRILGLPESLLPAAIAAVEAEAKQTKLSMDGIVQRIATEANRAERVGIATEDFLSDFLAGKFARRILEVLNLPVNTNFIVRATAVMKAEAKDTGLPMDEVASRITQAATEDRRRGERIDIFYLEDVRWRSNARASKAEQRKLGNLAANARAKEILRERFR